MNYIEVIAERLETSEPAAGLARGIDPSQDADETRMEGGRLLIGPRGVQLTKRDGTTIQIEADSVVVQMPDGKLVKMEALLGQFGPFDRR